MFTRYKINMFMGYKWNVSILWMMVLRDQYPLIFQPDLDLLALLYALFILFYIILFILNKYLV